MNAVSDNDKSILERHVQTILVTGIIALLSWVLLTVLDIRERQTKFEERLMTLSAQVNNGVDDRFRGADWRREKQVIDERFLRLESQIEKDHQRIHELERLNDKYHGVK